MLVFSPLTELLFDFFPLYLLTLITHLSSTGELLGTVKDFSQRRTFILTCFRHFWADNHDGLITMGQ